MKANDSFLWVEHVRVGSRLGLWSKKIVRWVYNQQTKPRDTTFYQTGVTLAEDIGHTW